MSANYDRRVLGLITIGQSPRVDMVPEMTTWLGPVRPLERGVLDEIRDEEIATLRPTTGDYALLTRLRDGSSATIAERHILPLIQSAITSLEEEGAPRIVQYIHATLHKALDQAVKWRLIPYNVSDAATKPRQKRSERDALTLRQVLDFFEIAKGDRFEALYVLAVFTGMRPGEMLALRWSDLVLDDPEPVARVRRSLSKDVGGRLVVKSTKTEKGRAIALLPQVVEALQTHRKRQAEQRLKYSGLWRNEDLVFPSKTGGPMSWDNLVRRNLKPLMRAAGLPETARPYDLRHTFATLMLEQGKNPKVVQEVLGHSRITHTMDTYSHVSPNIQKEAFGRLGKRLEGS